ncbi:hypothetical protein HOLleu_20170 [Holothuria leucospilota]|uniref:Uncharacterized protein n=1 Tax=Holothuria leucospilota TaxID=206669 RepID=A0A9Q1H5I3_HOLLE|nr:hypothetical protein HOLleu_20170 [Holothuria leucospilota]
MSSLMGCMNNVLSVASMSSTGEKFRSEICDLCTQECTKSLSFRGLHPWTPAGDLWRSPVPLAGDAKCSLNEPKPIYFFPEMGESCIQYSAFGLQTAKF